MRRILLGNSIAKVETNYELESWHELVKTKKELAEVAS
jgi:hypothetical protein